MKDTFWFDWSFDPVQHFDLEPLDVEPVNGRLSPCPARDPGDQLQFPSHIIPRN
jgi:hypothetical protein